MRFGKYVCMPFYVLLMRPFGIPLREWVGETNKPKAEWDKAALTLANSNSKAINAIFVVFLLKNFTISLM